MSTLVRGHSECVVILCVAIFSLIISSSCAMSTAYLQFYELCSQPNLEIDPATTQTNNVSYWYHVLKRLDVSDICELKRTIMTKMKNHTVLSFSGETTMVYLQRHGQRIPLDKYSKRKRKVSVVNTRTVSRKRQREEKREQEK